MVLITICHWYIILFLTSASLEIQFILDTFCYFNLYVQFMTFGYSTHFPSNLCTTDTSFHGFIFSYLCN